MPSARAAVILSAAGLIRSDLLKNRPFSELLACSVPGSAPSRHLLCGSYLKRFVFAPIRTSPEPRAGQCPSHVSGTYSDSSRRSK